MIEKTGFVRRLAGVLLVLVAFGSAVGELSVDPTGKKSVNTLYMASIGEGHDPFDPLGWQLYRSIPPERVLNASGAARGDGRADIAWDPVSGHPAVVWAYNAGSDHDVAFSEWTGFTWTPVEFLTAGTEDEIDPRVTVAADGAVHVVWWRPGSPDEVWAVARPADSTVWDVPVPVTESQRSSRRPSVVVHGETLRISYEQDPPAPMTGQHVVVAREWPGGTFVTEVVGHTERTDRLETLLHVEDGELWIDWIHAETDFGYSQAEFLGWSAPQTEPWSDPSWVGVEDVRRRIRAQVLAGDRTRP